MTKPYTFALGGGMDEVTQPLAIPPGRVIACLNHEAVENGYARVAGYERFDGKAAPSDFPFYLIGFTDGATPIETGDTITGGTSGATGVVLLDAELTAGAWDGAGAGVIGFRTLTGSFVAGEDIEVGGDPVAVAAGAQYAGMHLSGDATERDLAEAARDYARAQIAAVPGSGPVRGVVELLGTVYAFRDNAGATAGVMHKSTGAGWTPVDLGHRLAFTSGGATEITEGQTVTGATSGATAVVRRVFVQSGDWSGGTAAGYFTVSGITGTFVAENLNVGASTNLATIAAAPVANALPAGGRYHFVVNNFYGAEDARAIYGCNGVGQAFEFDGVYFTPITTGMANDAPNRVAEFRNHLFLAFDGGSIQHSAPAEPMSWEAVLGAAEIAFGSDVMDFISNIDSLIVLCEHNIGVLTGNDKDDWVKGSITGEAGAKPYTGQRFGPGIYLDNRGVRTIAAAQTYGNFSMGVISEFIRRTLNSKLQRGVTPVASCVVRVKNHYRMFFSDGSGISFYLGRKVPEPMLFDLGKIVRCIWSGEDAALGERVFFGADDGFVYQLERGVSFDGEAIEALCQLPYTSMGTPTVVKRAHKIGIEASARGATTIGVAVDYDYAGGEQTGSANASFEAYGAGGLWGVMRWDEFVWGAPVENSLEAHVDGMGRNTSLIIYSNSHLIAPYELRGATIYYSERGRVR